MGWKEQLQHEQQLKEQFAIFNVLIRDFTNVYIIDPRTDSTKVLKLEDS